MNTCDHVAIVDGGGNTIPDFRNRETHVVCAYCGEGFNYQEHAMKASLPKIGAYVNCPADRGDAPYSGRVTHVGHDVSRNIHGTPYVWVTVRNPHSGHSAVWPSHRLGFEVRS